MRFVRFPISALLVIAGLLLSACGPVVFPSDMGGTPSSTRVARSGFDASEATMGLMAALRATGADVRWGGTVNQSFLTVPGWLVRVNGQDVQAFEYLDAAVRAADTARMTTADAAAVGASSAPRFWAGDNLIVIYAGDQPEVVALLTGVMGQTLVLPTPAPTPVEVVQPEATPGVAQAGQPTPRPTMDLALVTPLPPGAIPVLRTNLERVEAVRDITIHTGPGDIYPVIGSLPAGARTSVTGISADGNWWRVTCPDGSEGSCWVFGGPKATRPIF